MSATVVEEPEARPGLAAALLPIMGVVFVAFLVIGVAMPVLPILCARWIGVSARSWSASSPAASSLLR